MPKVYNCRLYSNTGYNTGNVPANAAALPSSGYVETAAVFEWQDKDLGSLKVDATWESVRDIDYLMLGTDQPQYFVVTAKHMLSPKTAELSLTRDPLISAGGVDNINIIGGWAQRAHTGKDDLFGNTLPEPWQPSQRQKIRQKETISAFGGIAPASLYNIVICTCDLQSVDKYEAAVAKVADEAETGEVVFPLLPTMGNASPTSFAVKVDETAGAVYDLPHLYAFNLGDNKTPTEAAGKLEILRSMGLESAIVNAYVLPGSCIAAMSESDVGSKYIQAITGVYLKRPMYQMPYEYATVKNKKVFALYNKFTVVSITSGNSVEFDAHDLHVDGDTVPTFIFKSDPAPQGTVYCMPYTFDGEECRYYEQAVAGMPWNTAGLVYQGASGGMLTMANAQRANRVTRENLEYSNLRADIDQSRNAADTVLSAIGSAARGDIGGVASSIYGGTNKYVDTEVNRWQNNYNQVARMGDNIFQAQAQAMNVAPALAFPVDINASSYFGNGFAIYQTVLQDNDVQRLDRFLTMYGYAVDKKFDKSDLTNRTKFNYIKTLEALVTSPYASQSDCQAISDMFGAGVRIWHVPPTTTAFDDNPIKAGDN